MRYTAALFVRVCIAPHTAENPPGRALVQELVKNSPKEFSAAVMQEKLQASATDHGSF